MLARRAVDLLLSGDKLPGGSESESTLPADACSKCGHLRSDATGLSEDPPRHLPSSGRVRSARPEDSDPDRRPSVLIADDEAAVAALVSRMLTGAGYDVTVVPGGSEALSALATRRFDVVVSDIGMPGLSGLDLLRAIRSRDLDVPVILMTGNPGVETAMEAIALGAMQYLPKPIDNVEVVQWVNRATRLHRLTKVKREALDLLGWDANGAGDRAGRGATFDRALESLWMAFQPIVHQPRKALFGYEALLRSDEPLMRSPADVLDAAERLGRLHELGQAIRASVAVASVDLLEVGTKLFVNLHSSDLGDVELYSPSAPLSKIAHRVVLEITERASLDDIGDVVGCISRLKSMGFQIAIDDLGAGYAGLTSFTQLSPDIAKLDMSLVRGVDTDVRRQSIIRSMARLCRELGIGVIAEGVETAAERDMLAELGCELLQGYLFAKPARGFGRATW